MWYSPNQYLTWPEEGLECVWVDVVSEGNQFVWSSAIERRDGGKVTTSSVLVLSAITTAPTGTVW